MLYVPHVISHRLQRTLGCLRTQPRGPNDMANCTRGRARWPRPLPICGTHAVHPDACTFVYALTRVSTHFCAERRDAFYPHTISATRIQQRAHILPYAVHCAAARAPPLQSLVAPFSLSLPARRPLLLVTALPTARLRARSSPCMLLLLLLTTAWHFFSVRLPGSQRDWPTWDGRTEFTTYLPPPPG